jgi:hypothetical protein
MQLQRYFYAQLPDWARPDNPVLRHMLQRATRRRPWPLRWLVRFIGLALLIWLLVGSYQAYRDGLGSGATGQGESAFFVVAYFPLLALQLFTLTGALILTSNMVTQEQQRGTWEALKITSHGAELAFRARWAAAFYQMRWLLAALIIPRLIIAGQMLVDLTDYQGYHLDLYIDGITPEVSLEVAIVLLAAFMTAALIQPFVMIGLNAAIGLFLSTVFRSRPITIIAQVVIVLIEFFLSAAALSAGWTVLNTDPTSPTYLTADLSQAWGNLLFMASAGDQSLRLMNLQTFLQAWTDVDYAVLLGAAILAVVMLMAVLTNGLLLWAAHRASRPARE